MQVSGTIAIVTGGASGLGAATAARLAGAGAQVALFDLDAVHVEAVAARFGGFGLAVDVTDEDSVVAGLDAVASELGDARILVNCAGVAPAARIVGGKGVHDLASFRRTLDINVTGTFNVLRLFAARAQALDPLEDGERAVVINTASTAAYEGQVGQAAYSASKGAIVALTLPAAREFAPLGIRVNAIAPGTFETPMLAGMPEQVQQSLAAAVPFPARLGRAEEYASLAEEIVTNPFLNGTVIRLDGALRMGAK